MTPRQLHALLARHFESLQREEWLVGVIAASVTNSGFCRPEKPVSPERFMLHPLVRPAPPGEPAGPALRALFGSLPAGFVQTQKG